MNVWNTVQGGLSEISLFTMNSEPGVSHNKMVILRVWPKVNSTRFIQWNCWQCHIWGFIIALLIWSLWGWRDYSDVPVHCSLRAYDSRNSRTFTHRRINEKQISIWNMLWNFFLFLKISIEEKDQKESLTLQWMQGNRGK